MKITKQVIKEISNTVERRVSVGGNYHIVSSYGYAGIDWGTVKVMNILSTEEVPKPQMNTFEDGGIEPNWLEEPWIEYRYTHVTHGDLIGTDTQYLPAELFIRHTVAP